MAAIPSLLALLAVAVMLRAANFGPRRLFPCRFSTKPQNKATSEWPRPKPPVGDRHCNRATFEKSQQLTSMFSFLRAMSHKSSPAIP